MFYSGRAAASFGVVVVVVLVVATVLSPPLSPAGVGVVVDDDDAWPPQTLSLLSWWAYWTRWEQEWLQPPRPPQPPPPSCPVGGSIPIPNHSFCVSMFSPALRRAYSYTRLPFVLRRSLPHWPQRSCSSSLYPYYFSVITCIRLKTNPTHNQWRWTTTM